MDTIVAIIILVVSCTLMAQFPKVPAILLQRKFEKLGHFTGKSFQEIVSVVGKPMSHTVVTQANGAELIERRWQASMFGITLKFDKSDDVCLGLVAESSWAKYQKSRKR